MMLAYTEEMVLLQTELQATAPLLTACDWTCVDTCAKGQPTLLLRVGCLDTCNCYAQVAGPIAKPLDTQ